VDTISLLERGVVCAVAHVRGGGELGRAWHENGRRSNKYKSATDFVDCAEYLVERGWTTPGQLALEGRSAGACVAAAAVNMRPDLFGAVHLDAPFLDVRTAMAGADNSLVDLDDWASPGDQTDSSAGCTPDPYGRLSPQIYPPVLATTQIHDSSVPCWHAATYVARLRDCGGSETLLWCDMEAADHRGRSNMIGWATHRAFSLAWLIAAVNALQGRCVPRATTSGYDCNRQV